MPLFRPEAARGQDTLHGEISLVPSVKWQTVGLFLLGAVVVALTFVAFAGYGKVTVVSGVVSSDRGLIRITPTRAGAYDAVYVQEGQTVRAGTPLAHLTVATADTSGVLQSRRAQALAEQRGFLGEKLAGVEQGGRQRIASLQAQIAGDLEQAARLQEQIAQERVLIRSAEEELESVQTLAKQGYLTGSNLRTREEQVATRKQTLSRLSQEVAQHQASARVAQADIARVGAETRTGATEISGAKAELDRGAAGDDLLNGILLKAPVDGVVTGVIVHPGDPASPASLAMTVIPKDAKLEATLAVPTSAVGLLDVGQPVRFAVDAFPFQIYGSLTGVVTSISRASLPLVGKADGGEAFLARTTLPASIMAYGVPRPLRPGMTLTARIRTRPRSLLSWLFDPVLAVQRR